MRRRELMTLLVLLGVFLLSGCGTTALDAKDYWTIAYEGMDTRGCAKIVFDEDAFTEAALGKEPETEAAALRYWQDDMVLLSAVDYTVEPGEGLSNGDKVQVTVTWDKDVLKDMKLSLKNTSWSETVEGLPEGTVVDLFANLEIEYNGVDGSGVVWDMQNTSEDPFLSGVCYSAQPERDLSNGDQITVTAQYSESAAEEACYMVNKTEAVYTVDGLGHYLTDAAQIQAGTLRSCWELIQQQRSDAGTGAEPVAVYMLLDKEETSEKDKAVVMIAYTTSDADYAVAAETLSNCILAADNSDTLSAITMYRAFTMVPWYDDSLESLINRYEAYFGEDYIISELDLRTVTG